MFYRNYLKNIVVLLAALCLVVQAGAENNTQTRQVEVSGEGRTVKLATLEALKMALTQVRGININSAEMLKTYYSERDFSSTDKDYSSSAFDQFQKKGIFTHTKGYVRNFDVLNKETLDDGRGWKVDLLVTIMDYKTPGHSPHSRRKLAVIPFASVARFYNLLGSRVNGRVLSHKLSRKLTDELTQTRKFAVLDRNRIDLYVKEKRIVTSGDAAPEEIAKSAQVLGADYYVIGKLEEAAIIEQQKYIKISGLNKLYYTGSASASYQVLVMPTRQIKWSQTVKLLINSTTVPELNDKELTNADLIDAVIERLADKIANSMMETIYPVRLVDAQPNGDVILNQGGKSVSEGTIFAVYETGKKLIDPYTGESLGRREAWVADIEIEKVMPKISYGRVIKGQVTDGFKKYLCRRKK